MWLSETKNILSPFITYCRYNTGQHMFVPASDSCVTITIDIDTATSITRQWQIKVTQYECANQNAPEEDCLQYHTAITGTWSESPMVQD